MNETYDEVQSYETIRVGDLYRTSVPNDLISPVQGVFRIKSVRLWSDGLKDALVESVETPSITGCIRLDMMLKTDPKTREPIFRKV